VNRDAVPLEVALRTDAAQQQQLCGVDRTATQHDFLTRFGVHRLSALLEFHADHAIAGDLEVCHEGVLHHDQVLAFQHGFQEGVGGAEPRPVFLCHPCQSNTVLMRGVAIRVASPPQFHAGFNEGARDRIRSALPRDVQLTRVTVKLARAALETLGAFEQRQHRVKAPA
jgi:hypothetical protein